MRQEANDGGIALELGLELWNQGQRLGVRIVEVEYDEARQILFLARGKSGNGVLLVFDEGDFDSQLAGGLLNLRDEEQILDEEEYLSGCILRNRNLATLRVVDGL